MKVTSCILFLPPASALDFWERGCLYILFNLYRVAVKFNLKVLFLSPELEAQLPMFYFICFSLDNKSIKKKKFWRGLKKITEYIQNCPLLETYAFQSSVDWEPPELISDWTKWELQKTTLCSCPQSRSEEALEGLCVLFSFFFFPSSILSPTSRPWALFGKICK